MIKKFKITAIEQGWLDSFNNYFNYKFQMSEVVSLSGPEARMLNIDIEYFNHVIAHGPAIDLEEVDVSEQRKDYSAKPSIPK